VPALAYNEGSGKIVYLKRKKNRDKAFDLKIETL
jgi:hypothetical protein